MQCRSEPLPKNQIVHKSKKNQEICFVAGSRPAGLPRGPCFDSKAGDSRATRVVQLWCAHQLHMGTMPLLPSPSSSFHHTHNSKRSTWWKPLSIVLLCIQFSFNCQVIPDELCGMGWPKSRDQVPKIFVIYIDILRHHCHHHRADNLDKVRFLVDQGIDHLVSLSPEKIPPAYAYPKYWLHHSKDCCMRIIILASLPSDQYNCHGIS